MAFRTDAQLALDEKIDLARTLVRYKARRQAARELNLAEAAIKRTHDREVASGTVSRIDFDSIGVGSLIKELPDDDDGTRELASGDADKDTA